MSADGEPAPPGPGSGAPPGGQPQPAWGPPPGAPYGYGYGQPVLAPDIPGAEQNGRRAALAIWVGLVMYVAQIAASLIVIPTVRDMFQQVLDDIEAGRTTTTAATPGADDPAYLVANLVSNLGSVVQLVVGVLVLMWVHKALTNAKALGFPLSHTPGWGVAGFIVPIINLWFPFQSMRDLFPEGNPHRRTAGVWFATWLGAQLTAVAMTLVGFVSTPAAWAMAVVVAGLYVAAAINLRRIIAESTTLHRDIAVERGWPIGPNPGWLPGVPPVAAGPAPIPGPATAPYPTPDPAIAPGGWAPPPAAPPKDPWSRN